MSIDPNTIGCAAMVATAVLCLLALMAGLGE
jgi:hypothetical protein